MARILLIETSASTLSVALAQDGVVLTERICREPRQQASLTAPLVKEVLDAASLKLDSCDAVAVSSGPGSYTGLRVGVSTAKGLCFGASLPLIAIGTLDVLVAGAGHPDSSFIVPMIDARRMEVYAGLWSRALKPVREIGADIVTAETYKEFLDKQPVYFFGNGAAKCMETINHPNAHLIEDISPLAKYMMPLAERRFNDGKFEDVAYFTPSYLKDYVAKLPKKLL